MTMECRAPLRCRESNSQNVLLTSLTWQVSSHLLRVSTSRRGVRVARSLSQCRPRGFVTCSEPELISADTSYPEPKDRGSLWCTEPGPHSRHPAPRLGETGQRSAAACGEAPASDTVLHEWELVTKEATAL